MVALREYSTGPASMRVDHARGLIRGVSLLGNQGRSANGRRYTPQALAEGLRFFRGAPVYVNHHRGRDDRKAEDKVARVINPRIEKGNVVGDLECLRQHPMFPRLAECATDRPWAFQMSINGHGRVRQDGREQVVEALEGLSSVDIVAEGATNSSLLAEGRKVGVTTIRRLCELVRRRSPKAAKRLHEVADAAGLDVGAEVPGDEGGDHKALLKQGFAAAVKAIVNDDSLDPSAKMAKIKDILKAQEKLAGGGDDGGGDDGGGDDGGGDDDPGPDYGGTAESRRRPPGGKLLAESLLRGREVRGRDKKEAADLAKRLLRRR